MRLNLPFESEGLFITTVLSHVFMCIPIYQLFSRRWTFEAAIHCFGMLTSFMYHLVQTVQFESLPPFHIEELQWHFLDNVGVIACFGVWFTYLAALKDPILDSWIKMATLMIAIVVQMPHPWNVSYTFGPMAVFALVPLFSCCHKMFVQKQSFSSIYDIHEVKVGCGFLVFSLTVFLLGLDDAHDPYRVYHGLWHVVGSFASLRLWRCVKDPAANIFVIASDRIVSKHFAADESDVMKV